MDIRRGFERRGVLFSSTVDENPLAFPLPEETTGSPLLRQLEALWIDERLTPAGAGRYLLFWSEMYSLERSESDSLGLPSHFDDLELLLSTHGTIRSPDFRITVRAKHARRGTLPDESRRGAAFVLGEDDVVIAPPAALELLLSLDDRPEPDVSEQLLYVARIKKAAVEAGAALDYFLENQDIEIPDGIGVETVVVSPDELHVRPVLEGDALEEFADAMGRAPGPARPGYTIVDGNRRRRVVLDPAWRRAADEVRVRATIRGSDVPRFLESPEAFLPDGIDLSRFSRRVRGIVPRKYTSQPYVRSQNRSRDWFTIGAEVERAGELIDLVQPDHVPGGKGDSDEADTETAVPAARSGSLEPPGSISPAEYAEMCRHVMETGEPYVRHEDGWLQIDPRAAEDYLTLWAEAELDSDGVYRIDRTRLPQGSYVLDVIDNLDRTEYEEAAALDFSTTIPDFPVPAVLRADLMDHQRVGYNWLRYLDVHRFGGLLADDMGLGKTVQVISFLAHLSEQGLLRPSLIVVPLALMENWHREIRRFCPEIRLITHHAGPQRSRSAQELALSEVVLTTYQTLRRDQLFMGQVDWQVVVSDEAQYVKNPTAQSTAVLKGMKARLRLALTGTPVENGLSELWCIIDFVQPGRLGSQKEFRDTYEYPMLHAEDLDEQMAIATRLQERLTPHYLRREKRMVLEDLPSRMDDRRSAPLGPRQMEYYAAVVRRLKERKEIPLAAVQKLLAISSHPELYQKSRAPTDELVDECPKLQATIGILNEVRARQERVLLFTRFKGMQKILQDVIADFFGIHAPIINGEVAGGRRLEVVDRFNRGSGFGGMILSPEAAGVGLNITGANHVIHYTRLWNPAKENQATDRVHRLGQTKPVTVYYPLVTADHPTVEQRLDELLNEKLELARNVVWPRSRLDVTAELQAWLEQEGTS